MAGIIAAALGVIALAGFLRRLFPALFAAVLVLAARRCGLSAACCSIYYAGRWRSYGRSASAWLA
jgi:hypothetical protein